MTCARHLCQWDILMEYSRGVENSEMVADCLWRLADWGALKEHLVKSNVRGHAGGGGGRAGGGGG